MAVYFKRLQFHECVLTILSYVSVLSVVHRYLNGCTIVLVLLYTVGISNGFVSQEI